MQPSNDIGEKEGDRAGTAEELPTAPSADTLPDSSGSCRDTGTTTRRTELLFLMVNDDAVLSLFRSIATRTFEADAARVPFASDVADDSEALDPVLASTVAAWPIR